MTGQFKEAKLIYLNSKQKEKLQQIKNEVTAIGGDVSVNQLIRDAIDILVCAYKKEIVAQYKPKKIRDLIKSNGR